MALEAIDLAASIGQCLPEDENSGARPLVDIVPNILRKVCVNACNWFCLRGKRSPLVNEDCTYGQYSSRFCENSFECSEQDFLAKRKADFARKAENLRATVAMAVSHKDTKRILECLDGNLSSLQEI